MSLTTSPIEITPTTLPASSTGRSRKPRAAHHCHAAFQLVVRLDRDQVARRGLARRRLLRIEPGSSTFMAQSPWVTSPEQDVVVDDQRRPDPVLAIWRKVSTTMSPERTSITAPLFWARASLTVFVESPLVDPVLARLI